MTKDIDVLRNILIDRFGEMPLWVRVSTYLFALLVSTYVLLHPSYVSGVVMIQEADGELPFREGTVEVIYDSQGIEFEINDRGIFVVPLLSKLPTNLELRFTVDERRYPLRLRPWHLLPPRQLKVFVDPGEPPRFRLASRGTQPNVSGFSLASLGGTAYAQAAPQVIGPQGAPRARAESDIDKIKTIIARVLGEDAPRILAASDLELDLNADAIQRSLIVSALEEEYAIALPQREWRQLNTISDIYQYVTSAGLKPRIQKVLRDFSSNDSLFIAPAIPTAKLENAKDAASVPANESVLGLLDATVFGSAREALVFGSRGVYYRTSWTRESGSRVAYIPYAEFPNRTFERAKSWEVSLGGDLRFVVAGSSMKATELVALLNQIKKAIEQAAPPR